MHQRITLSTQDSIHVIKLADVLYCCSSNSYTTFNLLNKEKIVVSRSLKSIEHELESLSFFRSHQTYLVNLKHVVKVDRTDSYCITLTDHSRIPTSTRKRKDLLQILNLS